MIKSRDDILSLPSAVGEVERLSWQPMDLSLAQTVIVNGRPLPLLESQQRLWRKRRIPRTSGQGLKRASTGTENSK